MGVYGALLRVHCAGDRVEVARAPIEREVFRAFIGGVGLGAYLLWRYAPPGVDPLDPAAPVILTLSPLIGTPLTTTAKMALICKSPLTGRISDGLSSSRFALALARLGVDAVVITGRFDRLSRLHLDEALEGCRVEPCPALAGASPAEVAARVGAPNVAAIGLAGEMLVRYASLSNDGRHAGRGGIGAALGAKRIKAITVRGEASATLADPAAVIARARALAQRSSGVATDKYRRLGTAANLETFDRLKILPALNFQQVSIGGAAARRLSPEGMTAAAGHARESCAGCTIGCDHRYGGVRVEYESLFALGPLCGLADPNRVIAAAAACDRLGLDTISAGGTLAFAMECAEKGLVAWPLRFGDDLVPWLEAIAGRVGVGDEMAEGTRRLAARIGGGSLRFACQVKGMELPGYDPRAMPAMALGMAVQCRGADHNRSGAYQVDLRPGVDRRRPALEATVAGVIAAEDQAALLDSLILCKFLRGAIPDPWGEGAELLNMVAGLGVDGDDLRAAAARIAALRRLYNEQEGWTAAEETLPARFFEEPLEDGAVVSRAELGAMIERYYAARGWSGEGAVGAEGLARVGLTRWLARDHGCALGT